MIPYGLLVHLLQTTGTISYTIPTPQALIYALAIALIYGLGNYRDSLTKGEVFNYPMFLKTVVISLLAGGGMSMAGLDPQTNFQYFFLFIGSNTAIMKYVDQFVNNVFTFTVVRKASGA